MAGLVRGAHGELVEIELAEHHRAGVPEILAHRRFVFRLEAVEDVRGRRGQHALGTEQILDADRQAFHGSALAACELFVGRLGHRPRLVRRLGDEGIQALARFHGADIGVRQLGRGCLFRLQRVARAGQAEREKIAHYSTTFGTA